MNSNFLIYGAYGYSGELIAREAVERGLKPILTGRNEGKLKTLAEELSLEYSCFSLEDKNALNKALEPTSLVIHCVGPFTSTAQAMLEACLQTKTHYTDITGEIDVFEKAQALDDQAKEKGIMLMPGVGFDVVTSDCLAVHLSKQIESPNNLALAFANIGGGLSHGTALSSLNKMGKKSNARINGKIEDVPWGQKQSVLKLDGKEFKAQSIPWGDVFTAYYSTGIENIYVCMQLGGSMKYLPFIQNNLGFLLRPKAIKGFLKGKIDRLPAGPNEKSLESSKAILWGDISNAGGDSKRAILKTPGGYVVTYLAAITIAQKILNGNFKAGYQTPAQCYGEELALELPGVEWVQK